MPRLPFYLADAFVVKEAGAAPQVHAGGGGGGGSGPATAPPQAGAGGAAAPSGNPAAAVLIPPGLAAASFPHAALAAEFNQAETAFVVLPGEDEKTERKEKGAAAPTFGLRWFTPTAEVVMCGHATLGAAAALADAGWLPPGGTVAFDTLSGRLVVRRGAAEEEAGGGTDRPPTTFLTLDLPVRPPTDALPACAPSLIAAALTSPAAVVKSAFSAALGYLALEIAGGPAAVSALAPSSAALLAAAPRETTPLKGLIVLSVEEKGGGKGAHPAVYWRFFGPWIGIPEDAATGSAAAVVGPWLVGRKLVASAFRARQLSPRGGEMGVEVVEGVDGTGVVKLGAGVCVRVRGEMWV